MNPLVLIARAAIAGDALQTRSLVQDWLRTQPVISLLEQPIGVDQLELALVAGLAELFALRTHQAPPPWSQNIGAAESPLFLLRSAERMTRLRRMCEEESPAPLRRRQFFAPSNYLDFR